MQKKRILITGVSGLLGNNLAFCLKDSYEILGIYHNHRVEIDGIQTRAADLTINDVKDVMSQKFQCTWKPLRECLNMIFKGEIVDSLSIISILAYANTIGLQVTETKG